MHTLSRKHIQYFLFAGLFFVIDRVLKLVAPQTNSFGFPYIGFEYFENTGIAFGLPVPQGIIVLLTPIIVILLLAYMHDQMNRASWFAWSLMCAGALSNFIDRVLFGFVVDYIRIGTAVINIADVLIIVGIILLYMQVRAADSI